MRKLKIIFQIFLVVVFLSAIVFAQVTYKEMKENAKYCGLKVNINDSSSLGFISKADIIGKISSYNLKKGVTLIKNVPLETIEANFRTNPYINHVEVYGDVLGYLNVDVEQFIPCMRIIDSDGLSYFIDKHHKVVQQRHYVNMSLPVVTQSGPVIPLQYLMLLGNKADSLTPRQAEARRRINLLTDFVEQLEGDDTWNALVSQVNISGNGDIELVPRLGVNLITLCYIDSLTNCDRYFDKMAAFYRSQTNNGVWTEYSSVDFKYEGQVVCKKIKK